MKLLFVYMLLVFTTITKELNWCFLVTLNLTSDEAHRDVEINAAFVLVVADKNRLYSDVGHIDGAREEEENSKAAQQQADHDRC